MAILPLWDWGRARRNHDAASLPGDRRADVVIGYSGYFAWVEDLTRGKECLALPLTQEVERARLAVDRRPQGRHVAVISSGDAGIYGMASLVLETVAEVPENMRPEVVVVPGISAVNACASLLGAPLGHDFAVISLSDLLTPWDKIERRLTAAAEADFVIALLNPRSERRTWQLPKAVEIISRIARQRDAGRHRRQRLSARPNRATHQPGGDGPIATVDMLSTVIIGNSQTRRFDRAIVTPRGYRTGA